MANSLPHLFISLPNLSISLPHLSISLPHLFISLSHLSISLSPLSISLPELSISLPHLSISLLFLAFSILLYCLLNVHFYYTRIAGTYGPSILALAKGWLPLLAINLVLIHLQVGDRQTMSLNAPTKSV